MAKILKIGKQELQKKYGPWVLIIGAAEGLGEAFSLELAHLNFNLFMVDNQEEKMNRLADHIESDYNVKTHRLFIDLANPNAHEKILMGIGGIECKLLVYNAAYSIISPFLSNNSSDLDKFININCKNELFLVHGFAQKLKSGNKAGGILLMSSLSGLIGMQLVSSYAATKAFTWNLAEGLFYEFKKNNIDIMACIAGRLNTPAYISSNPKELKFMPAVMEPEEVVRKALKQIGKRALYIPGFANRLSYFILLRLLPRSLASKFANDSMLKLYNQVLSDKI